MIRIDWVQMKLESELRQQFHVFVKNQSSFEILVDLFVVIIFFVFKLITNNLYIFDEVVLDYHFCLPYPSTDARFFNPLE